MILALTQNQSATTNIYPLIDTQQSTKREMITTQRLIDPQQAGNHQADPLLQSYKAKLLNESKHVYFPTWFESMEKEQNQEDNECEEMCTDQVPEVNFTEEELTQFRSPWRRSLIVQTVSCSKSIPDIGYRLQKIWKTENPIEVTEIGQGFYIIKFKNPEGYFRALIGGPWFMFQYHLV